MNRASTYQTEALFKGLRTLLVSLPTEEEKAELLRTLNETAKFLEELQVLVEAFPTAESSQRLSQGLSRLDILADRAVNDAPLRKVMGIRGVHGASNGKKVSGTKDAKARALNLKERVTDSSDGDIAEIIEKSKEPLSVLTELASSIGLQTRSKERKTDLIKRIATHITNQQGYKILRGEKSDSVDTGAA